MLHRPWLAPLIVGFWCLTTGWLFVAKVLPVFHDGEPPRPPAHAADGPAPPVAWSVFWNDDPIGWALTEARPADAGHTLVESRFHCDRLPIGEMLPSWAGAVMPRAPRRGEVLSFDAISRILLDATGRPLNFRSSVTLPGAADALVLSGTLAADGEVRVEVRSGDLRYETTRRLPVQALVGDELSPQAMLPGLSEGRRWTVPIYSPLRPGAAPLQLLHARVAGEETIFWDSRLVTTRRVTYHEDPTSSRPPRCRLWVDRAGRVLRHESTLFDASLQFVRRTDAEAERLAELAVASPPGAAAPAAPTMPRGTQSP